MLYDSGDSWSWTKSLEFYVYSHLKRIVTACKSNGTTLFMSWEELEDQTEEVCSNCSISSVLYAANFKSWLCTLILHWERQWFDLPFWWHYLCFPRLGFSEIEIPRYFAADTLSSALLWWKNLKGRGGGGGGLRSHAISDIIILRGKSSCPSPLPIKDKDNEALFNVAY